jgi:hypothetical protein
MVRSIGTALAVTACAAFGALVLRGGMPAYAATDDASMRCSTFYNCWKGPGWYEEDEGGILAGPFASRVACEHAILAEGLSFEDVDCVEYLEQPKWDKRSPAE